MSTKRTICFEEDKATREEIHIYEDLFDEEHVFLEVYGFSFETESSMNLSGRGPGRVTICFPNEWARKLGLIDDDSRRRLSEVAEEDSEPGQGAADGE
jgi:uncharacterized protein involved in tellurium resistance